MEIIKTYEEEIAALELEKQKLEREREELIQQLLEQIQMADSKSRVERLTRIFNEGIRLGIAISKPGHEGKWIDITESAIKLVADLQ